MIFLFVVKRTVEFAESMLESGKNATVPAGLACIGPEVTSVVRDFYRIVQFNTAVFDVIYTIILEDTTPVEQLSNWTAVEPNIKSILKALAPKQEGAQSQSSGSSS